MQRERECLEKRGPSKRLQTRAVESNWKHLAASMRVDDDDEEEEEMQESMSVDCAANITESQLAIEVAEAIESGRTSFQKQSVSRLSLFQKPPPPPPPPLHHLHH